MLLITSSRKANSFDHFLFVKGLEAMCLDKTVFSGDVK
jgi:hypothetical protein